MENLHPKSPTPAGNEPTWPREHKQAVKYTKRFDSGVADIESDSEVTIRPMAASGGRALEYDYARGSHVYEDLPPKYVPGSVESVQKEKTGPAPVQNSSWPSTISTSTSQLSSNNNNTTDSVRKRHNPLYDAVQKQHPGSPPPETVISPSYKDSSRRTVCLCVCAVAAFIIAIISLIITVYIFISITPEKYAETSQTHIYQYQQLKADFDDLSQKYSLLSGMLLGDLSDGNSSDIPLAVLVARNQMLLQSLRSNLSGQQGAVESLKSQVAVINSLQKQLMSHNDSISKNSGFISRALGNITSISKELIGLEKDVRNVSKMEGPQGPQGVGNLSACYYIKHSQILPNAVADPTRTSTHPSVDMLQNFVVISATCSVTGGTTTSLENFPVDGVLNGFQYRCQCRGTVSGIRDRICYLHLWLCPRLS